MIILAQKIFEKEDVLSVTAAAGVGTYPKNNASSILRISQCFSNIYISRHEKYSHLVATLNMLTEEQDCFNTLIEYRALLNPISQTFRFSKCLNTSAVSKTQS